MDDASNLSVGSVTFDYTVKVEASPGRFDFLENMAYLDLDRLSQADRARIALGTVDSDCCRQLAYGVVEKGMLTAVEFDRDDGGEPQQADPGILELVRAASAALGMEAPVRKLPIPFSELSANARIVIETWQCIRICIFGWCILCCWGEGPGGSWGICSDVSRFPVQATD